MRLLKQSSTAQPLMFLMIDSTDHLTGKTGLSPTVTLSKSGAAFASPSGAVTELANGWYKVAGNATDTGTLGPLLLHATASGADPVDIEFAVVAFDPQSASAMITGVNSLAPPTNWNLDSIDGSGRRDVIKIAGTTQTARDLGTSVLLSIGTGTGQLQITSGVADANVKQFISTGITETSAGFIAAAFKHFFDVASASMTAAGVNQTADNNTILANGTYGPAALKTLIDAIQAIVGNGTYGNSALYTRLNAPIGPSVRLDWATNAATAGAAFVTALSALTAGQTLYVGPGQYDIGSALPVQPDHTRVICAGRNVTYFTSDQALPNIQYQCGSYSSFEGFTWKSNNADTSITDSPIGCATSGVAIVNTVLRNCRVIGLGDCVLFNTGGSACSLLIEDFILESGEDALTMLGTGGHYLIARNGYITATDNNDSKFARAVTIRGTLRMDNVDIIARARADGSSALQACVTTQAGPGAGQAELVNCKMHLVNTGTSKNAINAGNALGVDAINCEYDRSTVAGAGGVRDRFSPLRPTVDAKTLDVTATGAAGIDLGNVENQSTTLALSGTTIKNTTDIATTLADGTNGLAAIKTATGTLLTNVAAVPAAVWNALSSGLSTANSIGKRIVDYLTGDIFGRLGAPAGASIADDISNVSSGGGGTAAQVNNAVPVKARIFDLGTRKDGYAPAIGTCRMKVGDSYPVWIDTTKYSGGWLASASDESSSAVGLAVATAGINRELVVLPLTATVAGSYTITVTAHPRSADSIICTLAVEVTA